MKQTYHGSIDKVVVKRVELHEKRLDPRTQDHADSGQNKKHGLDYEKLLTSVELLRKLVVAPGVHGDPRAVVDATNWAP